MREKRKQPRAMFGKVRKHHWFKSARVTCRMAIEQRRNEQERKRVQEAHCNPLFGSISELMNNS